MESFVARDQLFWANGFFFWWSSHCDIISNTLRSSTLYFCMVSMWLYISRSSERESFSTLVVLLIVKVIALTPLFCLYFKASPWFQFLNGTLWRQFHALNSHFIEIILSFALILWSFGVACWLESFMNLEVWGFFVYYCSLNVWTYCIVHTSLGIVTQWI